MDGKRLELEFACRFCGGKETVEFYNYPDIEDEERTISREKYREKYFVCDDCRDLILGIVRDSMG